MAQFVKDFLPGIIASVILVARGLLTTYWPILEARSRQASTDRALATKFQNQLDGIRTDLKAIDVKITKFDTRLESIRKDVALIPGIVDVLEDVHQRVYFE
jgi:hypothetical protein